MPNKAEHQKGRKGTQSAKDYQVTIPALNCLSPDCLI